MGINAQRQGRRMRKRREEWEELSLPGFVDAALPYGVKLPERWSRAQRIQAAVWHFCQWDLGTQLRLIQEGIKDDQAEQGAAGAGSS
jgi:hypothetical protein